jgi:hypothetical protein
MKGRDMNGRKEIKGDKEEKKGRIKMKERGIEENNIYILNLHFS